MGQFTINFSVRGDRARASGHRAPAHAVPPALGWTDDCCVIHWQPSEWERHDRLAHGFHKTRGYVVAADVRLDQRQELVDLLGEGRRGDEISDGELIGMAWEKWASDFPTRLTGDFSIVIYDRIRRAIICARDHMAIRPLYYSLDSDRLLVGSSMDCILSGMAETPELSEHYLADYSRLDFSNRTRTIYKTIQRLPGGYMLQFDGERIERRDYWQPDLSELGLKSDGDYVELMRESFAMAVRDRLRGNSRVGGEMSGGLDSSSVACMAHRQLVGEGRESFWAYGAVFPQRSLTHRRIDEREYQQAIADHTGMIYRPLDMDGLEPMVECLWNGSTPIVAINTYIDIHIAQQARMDGVDCLLTGYDGDSVLSHGYELLNHLLLRGRWVRLLEEARQLSRHKGRGRKVWLYQFALRPSLPEVIANRLDCWLMGRQPKAPHYGNPLLQSLEDELDNDSAPRQLKGAQGHFYGLRGGLLGLAVESLRQLGDQFGVQYLFPFFDRRLIELSLRIPLRLRLNRGLDRHLFRQAMQGIVPDVVRLRPGKADLSSNFLFHLNLHKDAFLSSVSGVDNFMKSIFDTHRLAEDTRRAAGTSEKTYIALHMAALLGKWFEKQKFGRTGNGVLLQTERR